MASSAVACDDAATPGDASVLESICASQSLASGACRAAYAAEADCFSAASCADIVASVCDAAITAVATQCNADSSASGANKT